MTTLASFVARRFLVDWVRVDAEGVQKTVLPPISEGQGSSGSAPLDGSNNPGVFSSFSYYSDEIHLDGRNQINTTGIVYREVGESQLAGFKAQLCEDRLSGIIQMSLKVNGAVRAIGEINNANVNFVSLLGLDIDLSSGDLVEVLFESTAFSPLINKIDYSLIFN